MANAKSSLLPRWKTQYNAHLYPQWGETNTMPSMTVPDMALTIEEIVARSARGLRQDQMLLVPIYEGETTLDAIKNYMPDVMNMDPVDKQAYKALIDEQIITAKKRKDAIDEILRKQRAKRARNSSDSERTLAPNSEGTTTSAQPNPISEKNRPAGEANTRGTRETNKNANRETE